MKLGVLMEGFVDRARETTVPSMHGPVQVNHDKPAHPVQPMNRWVLEDKKRLRKCYQFKTLDQKNLFVFQWLQFEELKAHHAIEMVVRDRSVELVIGTVALDTVTDLDKEHAKRADVLYREAMYLPVHAVY